MQHSLPQRALAETLGTGLLVLVGPGSVVATLTLAGDAKPAVTGADLLGISFAFGGGRLRPGEGLGRSHQSGGHVRAGAHQALLVA